MEGLIFRGAYVRREISVSKSIGLALFLEQNLLFVLVLLCTTGQFPSTFWRGDLTEGFLRYEFGGLILFWRGLFSEFYGSYMTFLNEQ